MGGVNSYRKDKNRPRQSKNCKDVVRVLDTTPKHQPTVWSWTLVLLSHSTEVAMYRFQFIHATKSGDTKQ